jgi:hypothetical protein
MPLPAFSSDQRLLQALERALRSPRIPGDFVGDVHQPLHDETRFRSDGKDDQSGNDVVVTFFGQTTKLDALPI